jgi:hypothetical protein
MEVWVGIVDWAITVSPGVARVKNTRSVDDHLIENPLGAQCGAVSKRRV